MEKMIKSKTFWTGIGAIAAAGIGYYTRTMPAGEALQTVAGGLGLIFLRQGVEKNK